MNGRADIYDPFGDKNEDYALGPDDISAGRRDGINIRVTVDVNDKRTGKTYILSNLSVRDLSKSELAKLIDDLARQCLRECALKHYDEIFKDLNGLQKLQRVAKDVKDGKQ